MMENNQENIRENIQEEIQKNIQENIQEEIQENISENMRVYRLDGRMMKDREHIHPYLKERLDLPDYYGNNLDALNDVLTEMLPVRIIIEQADLMEREEYAKKLLDMLRKLDRYEDMFELREINDSFSDQDFSEVSD